MNCTLEKLSIPPTNLLTVALGFQSTETMLEANRLHIFDKLDEAGEPVAVDNLAKKLSVDPGGLERLMNACTTLGFLTRAEHNSQVFFSNTAEATLYLTKRSPSNLSDIFPYIEFFKVPGFKLDEPVRTGKHQFHKAAQVSTSDPEDAYTFYRVREKLNVFMHGMKAFAKTAIPLICKLELGTFTHAVDLGGGIGVHARTLKSLYPKMKVTLAELSIIIKEAQKDEENADLKFAVCDFMNAATLPKADLYVMGHILHNWGDEKCKMILRNVYDSLLPGLCLCMIYALTWSSLTGGCLLILEKILGENKDGSLFQSYNDLFMLVAADGKERREQEYKELITSQGFENFIVHREDSSPYYDAMMAYKC